MGGLGSVYVSPRGVGGIEAGGLSHLSQEPRFIHREHEVCKGEHTLADGSAQTPAGDFFPFDISAFLKLRSSQ